MKKRLKILSFKAVGTVIPHSLNDVQTTLCDMGHRVFVVDISTIKENHLKEIAIMDALVDIDPDLVITIDSVGLVPWQYLKMKPEMKVVSWFFDDPTSFIKDLKVSQFNSRYHLFCWDRAYEDVVKSLGVSRFHYLPFATNPKIYRPASEQKIYEVSFVGTWSEKRQRTLIDVAENGIKIDLFGDKKWLELKHENIIFHGFADNRKDCPRIYSQSKINLNITNEQLLTSLPLRIFDVGACKTFLLTDDQEDAKKLFSKDELIIYKDTNDLVKKVHYYLDHSSERELISENLFAKILSNYTYQIQLSKLLSELEKDARSISDTSPNNEELMVILWKTSLSLIHFAKYEEAISLLNTAGQIETKHSQKRIVNALTMAVCLHMSGREKDAQILIESIPLLKTPFDRLISIPNYAELRTELYYLKDMPFTQGGTVRNSSLKRIKA